MKPFLTIISVIFIFLSSCTQQKIILGNSEIFKFNSASIASTKDSIISRDTIKTGDTVEIRNTMISRDIFVSKEPTVERFLITRRFKAAIVEKEDYLIIESDYLNNTNLVKIDSEIVNKNSKIKTKEAPLDRYYFDEIKYNSPHRKALWYYDSKLLLQGLTIPIKIRGKLNESAFRDSFPSQTETGINVALAGGMKFTWNQYRSKKNVLGENTQKYSLSFGTLFGLGAVDLKKSNTRNPVIEFERRAVIVTTGLFLMLGVNNVNVGYAIGSDRAKGNGGDSWVYDGKVWHGVTIGIDIIK